VPIPEEEVEFSYFRSSGPGGQKKNTTDSAVRVRHLPTGIMAVSTASRSQFRNKALALKNLEEKLAQRNRRARPRIGTRPSLAARKRRIEQKRHRGLVKRLRRPPEDD
jgi:ribosome-associated protein